MIKLLRSTSMRLALGYAGLFVVFSLILVGLLWWRTAAYLDREIDAVILSDTRAIGDRLRDFGLAGALETVRERTGASGDKNAIYLMTNPAFQPLAGNLASWPSEVSPKPGWYQLPMLHNGDLRATRLLNVALPGGFELLVGRDVEDRLAVRRLIVNGLGWGTFSALILAALGGLFARRALMNRIDVINHAAKAIVDGDLTRRLPVRGSTDEFDQLSFTINQMLGQIQTLIEGVQNVSNAVAHDLRTPLAEVRAQLEDILRAGTENSSVFEHVEAAIDRVDRLIETSNALLRLAEVDSGVRRSGFRQVDLAELVLEVGDLYEAAAKARDIEYTVTIDARPFVTGDPFLLAQAVANLIDNALKFVSPIGEISIRLVLESDGRAEIVVTDNGPGIPHDERARAIERFYRSDSSRGKEGVGLGLALVAAVAKLHHGTLTFGDNDPGLIATLNFPASAA
jgi:signal transduction histidine kinase